MQGNGYIQVVFLHGLLTIVRKGVDSCVISPIVTPVDCGPPVTPQNGFLESYTNTTEGSEVFYNCDQHMVLEGRMRAVCTRNGWSSNPADLSCIRGKLK